VIRDGAITETNSDDEAVVGIRRFNAALAARSARLGNRRADGGRQGVRRIYRRCLSVSDDGAAVSSFPIADAV
jgi:hypothetical protein